MDAFDRIDKKIRMMMIELPDVVANEALDYFKECFVKKEFDGTKWVKSDTNSDTLVQSGKLRDSLYIKEATDENIEIVTESEYSKIHNEGGTITVTKAMSKFFWSKFYATGNVIYKRMALAKEVTIPKRQFLGESQELNERIKQTITDYVRTHF